MYAIQLEISMNKILLNVELIDQQSSQVKSLSFSFYTLTFPHLDQQLFHFLLLLSLSLSAA